MLEAYRPVLKSMVEAQQQGAAAVPSSQDLSELDPDAAGGLGGLLGQFALTLGPVFLGMQFGSAAGHLARRAFGQYTLPLPWPESATLLLVPGNVARFADDWSLPLQEVQLWVCLRELTMHAVLTRPAVRSSLATLLGDASAHAAAAQRSIVERLGDGLTDPAALEDALGDPEALLSDLISPEQRNISSTLDGADDRHRRLRGPHHGGHRAKRSPRRPPRCARPGTATGLRKGKASRPSLGCSGSTSARRRSIGDATSSAG